MNANLEELIPKNLIFNNVEDAPPYPTYPHVIEKLKPLKATGSDNVPAELIKQGGIELKRRIHKLIIKV
jgi:hypothetical protein